MKITTSYNSLVSLLNLMGLVTSAKIVQDDLKVVNFFVKDNKLYALSTDSQLYCLDTFEGTYDLEGEDNPFMVVRIKEIMDILTKYASLQRTEVKEIVLQTQQKGIVMTVVEEPKLLKDNTKFDFSDLYKHQESRFKLSRSEVRPMIQKELVTMVMPDGYTEMKSIDFQKYLDYMYPPMTKPREVTMMHFNEEYVYSVMGNVYGMAMPNRLPKDIFTDMSITLNYVNFLRNVVSTEDTFKIYKEVQVKKVGTSNDDINPLKLVTLIMQFGSILVKLRLADKSDSYTSDSFKINIKNTVEVDKPYFLDSLKRIEGYDQVFVEVSIKEDDMVVGKSTAEMVLKTQRTIQRIPIKSAHGSGDFKFMLRPESLGLLSYSHLTKDIEGNTDKVNDLIFCLEPNTANFVSVTCMDKTDDWMSRYPRAPYKEAPQLDF